MSIRDYCLNASHRKKNKFVTSKILYMWACLMALLSLMEIGMLSLGETSFVDINILC